jgi:hypothetical protein
MTLPNHNEDHTEPVPQIYCKTVSISCTHQSRTFVTEQQQQQQQQYSECGLQKYDTNNYRYGWIPIKLILKI